MNARGTALLPSALVLIGLVVLAAPGDGLAGAPEPPNDAIDPARIVQDLVPAYSPAELGRCRSDLRAALTDLTVVADRLTDERVKSRTADALEQIDYLDDADLATFLDLGPRFVEFRDRVREMRELAETDPSSFPPGPAESSAGFPSASYFLSDTRPRCELTLAAVILREVVEGIKVFADVGCETVVVALGFGGNPQRFVCTISDLALAVANGVIDVTNFLVDSIDASEIEGTYERVGHLHGDIEGLADTLAQMDAKLDSLLFKVNDLAEANEELRTVNCEMFRLLLLPQEKRMSELALCPEQ